MTTLNLEPELLDYALLSLEEAQEALNAPAGRHDSWIVKKINSITGRIEAYCRRKIRLQTISSLRIDGNGKAQIHLPYIPVSSVSSVVIHSQVDDSVTNTINDTSTITVVSPRRGLVRLHQDVFTLGQANVAVTFRAGFTTLDYELEVAREAAGVQLVYEYLKWEKKDYGIVSKTDRDGNASFLDRSGLLSEVKGRLKEGGLFIPRW